jgi:hypothetical protein
MNRLSTCGVILILLSAISIGFLLSACGEDTVCDKAKNVQKKLCEKSEHCFPCNCVHKGKDWEIVPDELGRPDLTISSCTDPDPCEGTTLEMAEACIENENICDPRYYAGILLFDQGEPSAGFEAICGPQWE